MYRIRHLFGRRIPSWRAGFAVRRDNADGTHQIFDWRPTASAAARRLRAAQEFWRGAPILPVTWSLVEISRRDAVLHRQRPDCRAPDCAMAMERTAVTWGALV